MRSLRSARWARLGLLLLIRYTPLPWRAKRWLIWLGGPKVLLGACALVEDDQGRVLVLRSRYSGDWQLPGGCVRRRETVAAAVRRECLEELGLAVRDPHLRGVYVDMHGLAQCALFRCRLEPGSIRLSEEHTAYRYLATEELPDPLRQMVSRARAAPAG